VIHYFKRRTHIARVLKLREISDLRQTDEVQHYSNFSP